MQTSRLETSVKWSDADQSFMRRALDLARRTGMTEVPVGALLVLLVVRKLFR